MKCLKFCSHTISYVSVLVLLLGMFSCSTPYTPTQPLGNDESNKKEYDAELQTIEGRYRDTATIKGKNFGDHAPSLAVYLNNIHINAVYVNDSVVKFIIPENIERKTYLVRLQIVNEITEVGGELRILFPKWYNFTSVRVSAYLYGNVSKYEPSENVAKSFQVDIGVLACREGSVFNSRTDGAIITIQDGCRYYPCYRSVYDSKYETYLCSSNKGVNTELDTINKIAKHMKISISYTESYESAFSSGYTRNGEQSIELENTPYKHVENGIEIYLESKDIYQKLKYARMYKYDSSNLLSHYSFLSSLDTFKEDNYIKIFLESEK